MERRYLKNFFYLKSVFLFYQIFILFDFFSKNKERKIINPSKMTASTPLGGITFGHVRANPGDLIEFQKFGYSVFLKN